MLPLLPYCTDRAKNGEKRLFAVFLSGVDARLVRFCLCSFSPIVDKRLRRVCPQPLPGVVAPFPGSAGDGDAGDGGTAEASGLLHQRGGRAHQGQTKLPMAREGERGWWGQV